MDSAAFERLVVELQDQKYAGMNAEQVVAELTAKTVKRFKMRFVNKRTFAGAFGPTRAAQVMASLKAAADADSSGTLSLIHDLLNTVGNEEGDRGGCDVGNAIGQAQVDALKTVMGFSDAEAEAIKALGVEQVSWFAANGLPELHEGDLIQVMGGN